MLLERDGDECVSTRRDVDRNADEVLTISETATTTEAL
jgi:hypothetical protein